MSIEAIRKGFVPAVVIAALAGAAGLIIGARLTGGRDSGEPSDQPGIDAAAHSQNLRNRLGSDGQKATSGNSYVLSNSPGSEVRLRLLPQGPAYGATDDGGVVDWLPDRAAVTMECWADGSAPAVGLSPRWFRVVEASGSRHPGVVGYVWSDLVWDQIRVPQCTGELLATVDVLREMGSRVVLRQGAPAKAGYYYLVQLERFPSGWHAYVRCHDSESDASFRDFTLVVGVSGTAVSKNGCYSGAGRNHWVVVDRVGFYPGLTSNTVVWATSSPSRPSKDPGRDSPSSGGSTTIKAPGTTQPAESTQPPPPATRTVTVYNQVTNGATAMREDVPAYLSTVTQNYCEQNGCALPGTDVSTGAQLTATCQTTGARTTNGDDSSSVDDSNPGLYTSSLWYGIRWPDGRFGYISEVWIQASDHGGLGLPGC